MLEEPFRTDLVSARALNDAIHRCSTRSTCSGSTTTWARRRRSTSSRSVRDGLVRADLESNQIDHVQIDVPKTLSVSERAGFYEQAGAFRDMVVTHLMQILAFVAMEPPTGSTRSDHVEKNKVFRSLRRWTRHTWPRAATRATRGGRDHGRPPLRRRQLALGGVPSCCAPASAWPRAPNHLGDVREPPQSMFPADSGLGRYGADHLTFDLDESARCPSPSMASARGRACFSTSRACSLTPGDRARRRPEAYQRLIRDAMLGDRTLFTTPDGSSGCRRSPSPYSTRISRCSPTNGAARAPSRSTT